MTKQQSRRLTGIRGKFLFGLAAILVFFSTLVAVTIYFFQKQALEDEAYRQASLIMTAMDASRGYVREVLRPKMYEVVGEDDFILEAMSSSYISRAIMELVSNEVDDFSYRRVSINARNPRYEASELEREMIRYFADNGHVDEWHDIIENETGERVFMQFQPVIFNESCMHCHGSPEEAPQKIIDNYGGKRGFYRQAGDVAGVVSVGLPVDLSLLKIKEFAFIVFSTVVPSILMLYLVISLFFNRLIAQNLRLLLTAFQTNLKDERGQALLEKSQTLDEIEELTGVAETIADHLQKSKQTVEQYAAEILRSKELLQSVFDGITDPVLLLEKEGKTIKTVNKAFVERYQASFEEVLGKDITSLSLRDSCPIAQCSEIIDKVTTQPLSKEMQLKDGAIYRIYFYPVHNETSEAEDIVCYVKDITEQRKLESHIQHTEKLVSMGQLAAGVAHEINNPLGVILCHLDLVKEETALSEEAKEDLKIIEKHVGNCRTIIADLLRFARQSKPSLAPGSINDLIREVVAMAANQMEMQSIQLETSLDDDIPPIPLDCDRMRQVFLNLLLNGAQAIEEQGVIEFSSSYDRNNENIVIIVEDNGCGITEDLQDKIFDPFFTTKAPGKGTGLGLSVSYSIIQDHGGTISIESSTSECRTRFIITLPVEEEEID